MRNIVIPTLDGKRRRRGWGTRIFWELSRF